MANSDSTNKNQGTKDDEIDLHQLWGVLSFNKYKIIVSGGMGLLLAVIYLAVASPIYQANALVQVEADKKTKFWEMYNHYWEEEQQNLMLKLI